MINNKIGKVVSRISIGHALIVMFGVLYYYLLMEYPFSFNYEQEINNQYYILVYSLLVYALWLLIAMIKKTSIDVNGVIKWLFSALLLVFPFTVFYTTSNEHFTVVVALALMSIIFADLSFRLMQQLWLVILVFYFLELYAGIVEYANGFSLPGKSSISGTLKNSGAYALYLVIHLPVLWYFIRHVVFKERKGLWSIVLYSVFVIITFLIIVKNQARTPLLMTAAGLLYIIISSLKKVLREIVSVFRNKVLVVLMIIVVAVAALVFGTYLIQLKLMSAMGRVLMLDVVRGHWYDHFWFGTGLGRFTWYYPQWQAHYFNVNSDPPLDFYLSAGESYIIFNEYLQFFKETGIVGFAIFTTSVIWLFKAKSTKHPIFLSVLKLTMAMLLAGGLTAYPFHVSPVIYLFFICFVNVFVVSDKAGWKLPGHATTKLLYGGSLLIVLAVFCLVCSKVIAVKQWHEIRSAYGLTPDNRIRSYEKLLPTLGGDGKFLAEFGEVVLEESSNYAKAFQLLEDSKKHFISYRGYNNTALACEQLNKVEGAIENYHFLSQYIPSRFHPKYAMFSVYRKFNDSVQAKQMAATILAMPVKIPSAEVTRMKMDAAEFLNRKEEGQ